MTAFLKTLKMIKIEHSIFALPFTLASAFLAARGMPAVKTLILIVLATVTARSAAMAFNRYLDAHIDGQNPRTAMRAIPSGALSRSYAFRFTVVNSVLFLVVCAWINLLTLVLAPFMLVVLLGYSYTKRFTFCSHLVLGLALGLGPVGAWAAVTGGMSWEPLVLGVAVMSWVSGFDMLYACQDLDFDRKTGLHSIPAALGLHRTLVLARILHLAMVIILVVFGLNLELGLVYFVGTALLSSLLIYEHYLVWGGDLSRLGQAFFTMNGLVSLVYGAAVMIAATFSI